MDLLRVDASSQDLTAHRLAHAMDGTGSRKDVGQAFDPAFVAGDVRVEMEAPPAADHDRDIPRGEHREVEPGGRFPLEVDDVWRETCQPRKPPEHLDSEAPLERGLSIRGGGSDGADQA